MDPYFKLRSAQKSDAADMAILDDMAGSGLSAALWKMAMAEGSHPFAHGKAQMQDRNVIYGFSNCRVAIAGSCVAGMATSYAMPVIERAEEASPLLAPVLALMAMAQGSWFVDALAVYPEHRRNGIAAALLDDCFRRARIEGNCPEIGLIVRSDLEGAMALYTKAGFGAAMRRAYVPPGGGRAQGRDYILMTAAL